MKLTWRRQHLRLRHRLATAQAAIDGKDTLVVTLEHAGVAGLGEVCPSRLYGHSVETSEATLGQIRESLRVADPFLIEPILSCLIPQHDEQRAAIAAVDSALHDWVGKTLGVPVWRLLGLARPRVRTTFTIGIASPDETRRDRGGAGRRLFGAQGEGRHGHRLSDARRDPQAVRRPAAARRERSVVAGPGGQQDSRAGQFNRR